MHKDLVSFSIERIDNEMEKEEDFNQREMVVQVSQVFRIDNIKAI